MSHRDVEHIVRAIEHSHTNYDGSHNFSEAVQDIARLQAREGLSSAFHRDMAEVNAELQRDGYLTNLEILGVDRFNHKLITKDLADDRVVEQNAGRVNDFAALGSGLSARERELAVLSHAMGLEVKRNGDGSYDVDASKIFETMLGGIFDMLGEKRTRHVPSPVPGFNRFYEAAWFPPYSSAEGT